MSRCARRQSVLAGCRPFLNVQCRLNCNCSCCCRPWSRRGTRTREPKIYPFTEVQGAVRSVPCFLPEGAEQAAAEAGTVCASAQSLHAATVEGALHELPQRARAAAGAAGVAGAPAAVLGAVGGPALAGAGGPKGGATAEGQQGCTPEQQGFACRCKWQGPCTGGQGDPFLRCWGVQSAAGGAAWAA